MEKAIQKAIEGGYKDIHDLMGKNIIALEEAFFAKYCLDPLFWQALGKAEGWDRPEGGNWCFALEGGGYRSYAARWQNEQFNFIDHLAEGKDINSFFEELLR